MNHSHEHGNGRPSGPNWSRINQWLLWIGLAAAVAWMFFRHNAHLVQLLPFLILLACLGHQGLALRRSRRAGHLLVHRLHCLHVLVHHG